MIKAVLLDVDNTILDFDKCSDVSIQKVCQEVGINYKPEFFPFFTKINDMLWKQVEDKLITKDQLHAVRFFKVFDAWGISGDHLNFEKKFKLALRESAEKVDGALDLVKYLSQKYVLAVASNSNYPQQIKRLTLSNLAPFINKFFFSAEIGHEKPSKEFFTACIDGLAGVKKDEIIIIGDSINADIKGGIDIGIKTCWFNFRKIDKPLDVNPDFIVNSLEEIKKFL